jgi:hypothetical protein
MFEKEPISGTNRLEAFRRPSNPQAIYIRDAIIIDHKAHFVRMYSHLARLFNTI